MLLKQLWTCWVSLKSHAEFYANYCLFKDKTTKKVLFQGILKGGLYQLDISKLEDGFKHGGSTSLHNVKNKTCTFGHVSLLSNVTMFHSSNSCNNQSTDALVDTSLACVNSTTNYKLVNLWHSQLGHSSKRVLSNVLPQLHINEITSLDFLFILSVRQVS